MLEDRKIVNNISELKSFSGTRISKYRRNYRYYHATRNASLDNIKNPATVGYNNYDTTLDEEDTTLNPQYNVIASCIDTLHSKIAQSKVRPFFNTINGTFKDIQAVKQAQQFFDLFFEEQNVNKTISEAFRDACIFDTGVVYIDDDNKQIRKALPHQIYVRPAEINYKKVTRVYYEQKDYPVSLLPTKVSDKFVNKRIEYVDYGIYYDTFNKTKAYIANGKVILTEQYDKEMVPFVFIYFKEPVIGNSAISITDMLVELQQELNILMAKIKDASQLSPAQTIFVPENADLNVINNRIGNVMTYKYIQGMAQAPITAYTPPFIDGEYLQMFEAFKNYAFELIGISELSSMSKKPTGLNSGIALSTMENIESDRFETQLNQVIRAYVDVAKACIKVFNEEENILPEIASRVSVKWKDIVKESNNMSIQYSAADSLSKDPSTKLDQLQKLSQAGVIPSARISQLMQIPDLEMGYSLSNNAIDAVMEVIKECIEEDNFEVPEYIPFELLKEEIINTQLSLKAAGKEKNKKDIEKLMKLYETVEDMEAEWQQTADSEAEAAAQAAANESGIAYNQNILESEANTYRANGPQSNIDGAAPDANSAPVPDVSMQQPSEYDTSGSWVTNANYDRA